MLPTIWLKSTEVETSKLISCIDSLQESHALRDAVHDSYIANAAKYLKTLRSYDAVLSSICTSHVPATVESLLASTLDAANSTTVVNFQIYRDVESQLWVGMTFHDPDLIKTEILNVIQDKLKLDSGKKSILGGIAISRIIVSDAKALVGITIKIKLSFSLEELDDYPLATDEQAMKDLFDNVILLLTVRNKELCATIEPQTIKEKINATRNSIF